MAKRTDGCVQLREDDGRVVGKDYTNKFLARYGEGYIPPIANDCLTREDFKCLQQLSANDGQFQIYWLDND